MSVMAISSTPISPSSSLSRSTMNTWLGQSAAQSGYSAAASPVSDDVNVTACPLREMSGSAAPTVEGEPSGSALISVTARNGSASAIVHE